MTKPGDLNVSISPVIEKWLQEGQSIKPTDLQQSIKQLHKHKYITALARLLKVFLSRLYYLLALQDSIFLGVIIEKFLCHEVD
jgi:hypothetical protein